MYDLIIRDATIVSSAGRLVADVAIQDGRIRYVGPRPPKSGKKEISAIGKFLMPGVIDTAVMFSPNSSADIWERESRAAVTGGVTTVVALPGGDHPVLCPQSAEARHKLVKNRSWCNYGLWAYAKPDNLDDVNQALKSGLVLGALANLSDDNVPVEVLDRFATFEGVLGVQMHPDTPIKLSSLGSTPAAEAVARTVKTREGNLHLVHLSTAAELDMLDPVRGNLPVTAGVTPHHLFLSLEEGGGDVNTIPPVRPEHDRRTLWTAVKRGRLDCIASDHHPANGADSGIPGSELLLPLMLSAVRYGRLSMELLVSLCAEAPARIFGLENKGRIERGADADLILFSEGEIEKVGPDSLVSGAGWSPYIDREAAPKPELVMVNGKIVASRGNLVIDKPPGKAVEATL